jgi:hypothetical protein
MEKKDLENGLNRISDDQIPDFIAREIAEVSRREILKYLSVGVGGALGGGILLESCKFGKKGGDSGVKNSTAGNLLFQLELQPELKSNAGYTPRSTFVAEYNKLMQLKMDNLMDFANRIQAIGDKPTRVGGEVGFIAGIKIWGDRMEAFAKMTKDYLAAPGNNLLDGEDEGVVNDIVSGLEPEMQRDIVEALGSSCSDQSAGKGVRRTVWSLFNTRSIWNVRRHSQFKSAHSQSHVVRACYDHKTPRRIRSPWQYRGLSSDSLRQANG